MLFWMIRMMKIIGCKIIMSKIIISKYPIMFQTPV